MIQVSHAQVLIVDRLEDTREVIQIALDRRGVTSTAASTLRAGLASAKCKPPRVIVLDADAFDSGSDRLDEQYRQDFLLAAESREGSLLILGELPVGTLGVAPSETLSKPYHFAALVNKIEELLAFAPDRGVKIEAHAAQPELAPLQPKRSESLPRAA